MARAGGCSKPPLNPCRHPVNAECYQHILSAGSAGYEPLNAARIDLSGKLTEAIWHMLTRTSPPPRQATVFV